MEWFNKSHKFSKPTNPSTLSKKSPFMFEYGRSIKPATILLRREAHLNTLPKENHICLAYERDNFLLPPLVHQSLTLFCWLPDQLQLFIYVCNASGLCLPPQYFLPSNLTCYRNQTAGEHIETTAHCTNPQRAWGGAENQPCQHGSWVWPGIFDYHSVNSARSVFKVRCCYSDSVAGHG